MKRWLLHGLGCSLALCSAVACGGISEHGRPSAEGSNGLPTGDAAGDPSLADDGETDPAPTVGPAIAKPDLGTLTVRMLVPTMLQPQTLHYKVTSEHDRLVAEGDVPVTVDDEGAVLSLSLAPIMGGKLKLSGDVPPAGKCKGRLGPFNVNARLNTTFLIELDCGPK